LARWSEWAICKGVDASSQWANGNLVIDQSEAHTYYGDGGELEINNLQIERPARAVAVGRRSYVFAPTNALRPSIV
jgi:hypothetical protein